MAPKISVVIPNYNGRHLLAKNLPKVIANCPNCQIIVVDDGSSDDSVKFIKKNFPNIKLIELAQNKGFARAANTGVQNAHGELVVLLNSDVAPRKNFLKYVLGYFKKDNVFAVAFADYSHEKDKVIIRGRGGASFTKGLISHYKMPSTKGITFWVSGGSGLFDKQKFLDLGGFDSLYAPFYWEDIDLAFRAWQKGYICYFEPNCHVDHYHEEGVIRKTQSSFFIKTVAYRNQFLFVWKNISDPLWLIQHLTWFPYHFAKAIVTIDLAFLVGFLWALLKIPSLIFNFHFSKENLLEASFSIINYQLSDRGVLNKFAKS